MGEATVFSVSDFSRKGMLNYPIFTLKKEDSAGCDELRAIFKGQAIEWVEHELPCVLGAEIGFVIPLEAWYSIQELPETAISDALGMQIHAWTTNPTLTPLPEGIDIPKESCVDTIRLIEEFIAPPDDYEGGWGRKPDEESYQIANVQTGEIADVYVNRKTKSYTISKDISNWKIVTPL